MAEKPLFLENAVQRASTAPPLQLERLIAALRTPNQKEEKMGTLPHPAIIGIDVSRDTLDVHCLPDGLQLRLPNTGEGHAQFERQALVCFEATGGHEWLLWADLDEAGVRTRQLPPAPIKAFAASGGVRAKTNRIDAETVALFMAFRPEAGRQSGRTALEKRAAL